MPALTPGETQEVAMLNMALKTLIGELVVKTLMGSSRRRGHGGLKWALIWAAAAVLAGPVIGKIMDEQGK